VPFFAFLIQPEDLLEAAPAAHRVESPVEFLRSRFLPRWKIFRVVIPQIPHKHSTLLVSLLHSFEPTMPNPIVVPSQHFSLLRILIPIQTFSCSQSQFQFVFRTMRSQWIGVWWWWPCRNGKKLTVSWEVTTINYLCPPIHRWVKREWGCGVWWDVSVRNSRFQERTTTTAEGLSLWDANNVPLHNDSDDALPETGWQDLHSLQPLWTHAQKRKNFVIKEGSYYSSLVEFGSSSESSIQSIQKVQKLWKQWPFKLDFMKGF